MPDQATEQPRAISPALAEPTKHVRAGWVTGLGLASLAMWMASYTPLQVLLPLPTRARARARFRRRCPGPGRGRPWRSGGSARPAGLSRPTLPPPHRTTRH